MSQMELDRQQADAAHLRDNGWVCLDPEALDRLEPAAREGLRDLERGRAVIPIITPMVTCSGCGCTGYHARSCPLARK